MIFQLITLAGVLVVGYKSWQRQDKAHNQRTLAEQRQVTQVQKEGKDHKSLGANLRYKLKSEYTQPLEMISLSMALIFSSVGGLLYPPLIYLSIPLFLYPSRRPFLVSWDLLKQGRVGIPTLMAGAVTGAVIRQHLFIASLLGFIFRIADILNSRVLHESHLQLVNIFEQAPKTVWLLKEDTEISIPLSQVTAGDILVVNAGEVIPADGHIVWGMAGIDQHRLTGESVPVEKGEGEEVFAMTLVLSGKIQVRVAKAGADTTAMKIAGILNQTADYKSLANLRAENFSHNLVHPALITAAIAWPMLGFSSAVAVLFIHPKERLSISASLSLLKHLNQASEQGILIKDGRSLELLNQVDTIVFDKTGTLTEEQPHIGSIHSLLNYNETEILQFAAIAEHKQTHPLAQAILAEAQQRNLSIPVPEHSEYKLGYGIKVIFNNQHILVGSARFMVMEQIPLLETGETLQATASEQGYGIVMVAVDGQLIGAIELLPTIRPEAKAVIQQLKQLKRIKHTCIISGDSEAPTRSLAQSLGIDNYFAQTLPDQKADIIKQLQEKDAFVCYVGDGINDAIAMKQAQVSVSLSGASHIATDTAQIVLLDQGICHLPGMFELAAKLHSHMNNLLGIMLGSTVFGTSAIFLAGWGMGQIMALNIFSILVSLGYSILDRPTIKSSNSNKLKPF
jgi:Cu2+-exporting ATPase